jgi:hypothetical protein
MYPSLYRTLANPQYDKNVIIPIGKFLYLNVTSTGEFFRWKARPGAQIDNEFPMIFWSIVMYGKLGGG